MGFFSLSLFIVHIWDIVCDYINYTMVYGMTGIARQCVRCDCKPSYYLRYLSPWPIFGVVVECAVFSSLVRMLGEWGHIS